MRTKAVVSDFGCHICCGSQLTQNWRAFLFPSTTLIPNLDICFFSFTQLVLRSRALWFLRGFWTFPHIHGSQDISLGRLRSLLKSEEVLRVRQPAFSVFLGRGKGLRTGPESQTTPGVSTSTETSGLYHLKQTVNLSGVSYLMTFKAEKICYHHLPIAWFNCILLFGAIKCYWYVYFKNNRTAFEKPDVIPWKHVGGCVHISRAQAPSHWRGKS